MRECKDCKDSKPLDAFVTTSKSGKSFKMHRCKDCYNALRKLNRASRAKPHTCRTCSAPVWDKGTLCRSCAGRAKAHKPPRVGSANERETFMPKRPLSERALQAAKHDSDQLRLKALARREGEPSRYMEIAYGEIWTLPVPCRGKCGKWVLIPARCFTCATGRPRHYLRAEERQEGEPLAQTVYELDKRERLALRAVSA